jgi:hypothetical protein
MSEQALNVKCPLCDGKGELSPSTLAAKFSNPELRKRFDTRMAEILEIGKDADIEIKKNVLDFQKVVHTWNQTQPIWRRSAKE